MSLPPSKYDREALLPSMLPAGLDGPDWSLAARPTVSRNPRTGLGLMAGQSGPSRSLESSLLPSVQSSLLSQSLGLATAAAARTPIAASLGIGTSDQLLISVASAAAAKEQQNLLNQARAALLNQHLSRQRERLLLQQSYHAILRNRLAAGGSVAGIQKPPLVAIPPQLLSHAPQAASCTSAASMPSRQAMQPVPASSKAAATKKALEALGSTLRQGSDPYIDVSSVKDSDAHDAQVKRTRGGGKFDFVHRYLSLGCFACQD